MATESKQKQKTAGGANGASATDPMAEAIAYEEAIAEEAAQIRGDAAELTPELFVKLWPLLKRPIPAGFIQSVGRVEGKPYESTGVRSVQVQIDRMNNVLTPLGWRAEDSYEEDGKLATVSVYVVGAEGRILTERSSKGGVSRGSGTGNIYKGSFTNAAKLAFARLGPGHEVYVGAPDLDPDVNPDAGGSGQGERPKATAKGAKGSQRPITAKQKGKLNALFAAADLSKARSKAVRVWFTSLAGETAFDRLPAKKASELIEALGEDGSGAVRILSELDQAAESGNEVAAKIVAQMREAEAEEGSDG